jgi:hypothetical protein
MATFLELAQKTAQESGVVAQQGQPISVIGQTGRLKEIVDWTRDAWVRVQNAQNDWRFMRREFTSTATTIGSARYTAASFGITDFAEWLVENEDDYNIYTCYRQSLGVADERPLRFLPWPVWRGRYGRGQQVNKRPIYYAISPNNEFCLGPIPDAAYIVRGEYRRTPQVLTENTDIPICPERFHDVIVWRAIQLLGEEAEAVEVQIPAAIRNYREINGDLMRDQRPRMRIVSRPLA